MRERQFIWILKAMEEAIDNGIAVSIDGICCEGLPLDVLWLLVDECPYMMDIDGYESGHITSINFSKITAY